MSLAAAYIEALPEGARRPPDLEGRLADLHARGKAAHPGLRVTDVAFARHLARCGAAVGADPRAVQAEDLFLVCAALAGEHDAVKSLQSTHRAVIAGYLRRIEATTSHREDIEHRLWTLLLVGDGSAPPKLASYSGRGDLAGFIGVCAQRIALTSFRRSAAHERALAGARAEAIAVGGNPELAIIKERYKGGFERAVRDALSVLDDRERMMLRMLVVDGHTHARIAEVYRLNQSSVSRTLAKARRQVLAEVRRLLGERLKISEAEFDSLANLVLSQLDLSVSPIVSRR